MEESVSGFKLRGDWGDIVEHGERITEALREAGASGGAYDEWNEWRPKSHERLGEDVSAKTAEQASTGEGKGEQAGKTPDDDLKTAGEKISESYQKLEEEKTDEAVDSWQDSVSYVARAADSASRKAIRKVEDTVYQKVMTRLAPYYFDNDLISANVQQAGRGDGEEQFVFEVNVNDDDLKSMVSEKLSAYEDEIDRWHVDTEKRTDTVEAAEGVEAPEDKDEPKSTTT